MSKNKQHTIMIMAIDALCITAAGIMAFAARFDFRFSAIPRIYLRMWLHRLPLQVAAILLLFCVMKMYRYMWRSVSARDVGSMVLSVTAAYAAFFLLELCLSGRMPRSVRFLEYFFGLILLVGIRCSLRFLNVLRHVRNQSRHGIEERIMLVGAGEAGRVLAREIISSKQADGKVCCFVDDNRIKWGRYLEGILIAGGRESIPELVRRMDITEIIVSIPSAPAKERKAILEICKNTGCHVKTLPGLYQLVSGEVTMSALKEVQVEDLLGRESVRLDMQALQSFLCGKTVLVTGGGGSIGSELCRQIARYQPKELIVLDIYENNAYELQQSLLRQYGETLSLRVIIASVRDKERIYRVFDECRPDIVFHAAAHKHVPLMEACPQEAVKNNIFWTYHVVRAAEKYGTKKFILISTDKAVNPTNFMGASKRFCEMILQSRRCSDTEFCAVRFGNVLGSNGSVVPLFREQIASGGPVTVTDKRIIRYFMTIPEAAQLVLEAGSMAKQNQIFVLDMGEPVKILTLAENMIRLSGLEPYRDIEIKEIGLRPGEKLYEELLMKSETLLQTEHDKIFVEQQSLLDSEEILRYLEELDEALAAEISDEELIRMMKRMVPTYRDAAEVNAQTIREQAAVC